LRMPAGRRIFSGADAGRAAPATAGRRHLRGSAAIPAPGTARHGRRARAAAPRASRRLLAGIPAQGAAPLDGAQAIQPRAGAVDGKASATGGRRRRPDASARVPKSSVFRRRPQHRFPAQLAARRLDGGPRAGQAQPELAVVPERGRNRQRLAAPLVEPGNRLAFVHAQKPASVRRPASAAPSASPRRARRASPGCRRAGARHRSRRRSSSPGRQNQHLPVPSTSFTPSTKSRTAPACCRRGPARPAATQPPTVAPAPPENAAARRPASALFGQRRLDLGQRRAAAGGDVELGRLVGDDAAIAATSSTSPASMPP
jgi:hypothetical protein